MADLQMEIAPRSL